MLNDAQKHETPAGQNGGHQHHTNIPQNKAVSNAKEPWPQWIIDDLAKSGISRKEAEKRGIRPVSVKDYAKLLKRDRKRVQDNPDGYWIPFPDPVNGESMKSPSGGDYGRVRYERSASDGRKYDNPSNAGIRCYIPPETHHYLLSGDPYAPLVLTEGEKKALCATLRDYPCVGLTGIWNWLRTKAERPNGDDVLCPDLLPYVETGRDVVLVYDSDATETKRKATEFAGNAMRLAKVLAQFGCKLSRVDLPSIDGIGKVGVDDYLVAGGNSVDDLRAHIKGNAQLIPPYVQGITAAELAAKELPEPRWAVPRLVPEGLTLLAGKSKIGKSWLALGMCHAVAVGGRVLGDICDDPGDVLYLALEDTQRRLQSRFAAILEPHEPWPDNLTIWLDLPSVDPRKNLAEMDNWLSHHPDCRLVCVDTLARVKPVHRSDSQTYERDSAFMAELQDIAQRHTVAVVLLHHTRKAESADVFDAVLGSTALQGVADTTLVLTRGRGDCNAVLHVTGRDVEEQELALNFSDGIWSVLGDAREFEGSEQRRQILELLRTAGGPMGPTQVSKEIGTSKQNAGKMLLKMAGEGLVLRSSDGQYSLAAGGVDPVDTVDGS